MTKSWTGLLVAALAFLPAEAEQYWVIGTSEDGGWYDVNKTYVNDSNLCWAASASNMLAWWQDHNPEYNDLALINNPQTPQGADAIFENFTTAFTNNRGRTAFGWLWFLNGQTIPPYTPDLRLGGDALGGYYQEAISTLYPELDIKLDFDDFLSVDDPAHFVSAYIKEAIQMGCGVTLGICSDVHNVHHAVTLWGIDFNEETQLITSLYLTDSDDVQYTGDVDKLFMASCDILEKELSQQPDGKEMKKMLSLSYTDEESGRTWYDDTYYVLGVDLIRTVQMSTPEPAAGTLGLLALAALCGRRRR